MNKQANNFKIRLFSGNVSSGPASLGLLENKSLRISHFDIKKKSSLNMLTFIIRQLTTQ